MNQILLKPRAGLKVRLENGMGYVAEEVQLLQLTAYVRRRMADGDLIVVAEKKGK